jgi:hypothetical protein
MWKEEEKQYPGFFHDGSRIDIELHCANLDFWQSNGFAANWIILHQCNDKEPNELEVNFSWIKNRANN